MTILRYGDSAARKVSERICNPVASITALKAIPGDRLANGTRVLVTADGSSWRYSSSCALTGDDILVVEPTSGSGAWLLEPGMVQLKLPFTHSTADAAVLYTIPTGALFKPHEFGWEITTNFTGGSSSAIGVSSTKTGYTTKGDLLGGASGNVQADLTTALSPTLGTVGANWETIAERRALWKATEIFRFDRITSAFTAGAGNVLVMGHLIANAGA